MPARLVRLRAALAVLSVALLVSGGCRAAPADGERRGDEMPTLSPLALSDGERVRVVATTSIVGAVVAEVGRDLIDLLVLLPPGTDPHTFQPVPQDVAAVSDAHVVFANGVGLERFLEPLLESAGEGAALVPVSHGVDLIRFEGGGAEAEEHGGPAEDPTAGFDPHTWFDPNNVIVWVRNIERALGSLDPGNAARYRANADAYESELDVLDDWIAQQIAQVPEPDRLLVTDHATFGYFARRYGFEQVGTLLPGYSTLSQPSAQELAELEEAIDALDVRAVFVGLTVSPELAERVANDTGTQLVFLYTGSLSEPGGPADDYISFMRYNVSAIVQALR